MKTSRRRPRRHHPLRRRRRLGPRPRPVPPPPPVAQPSPVMPSPPVRPPSPRGVASRTVMEPIAALEVSEEASGDDLKSRLETLCATPGVQLAALADREGFLIESAGDHALDA